MAIAKDSYSVPTYTRWNETQYGKQYSDHIENETMFISNHKGVLFGLPDSRYGVKINNMIEVDINHPLENERQFKVDYKVSGTVFFHSDFKGEKVNIKEYYSKGLVYFPAERIWTKVDSLGNVIESLQGVLDALEKLETAENDVNALTSELNKILDTSQKQYIKMTELIKKSDQTIDELNKLVNDSVRELNKVKQELIVDFNELYREYSKDLTQLQQDLIEDLLVQIKDINDEAEETIKDMQTELANAKKQEQELEENLKALFEKAETLNTQLDETYRKSKQLEEQLVSANADGLLILEQYKEYQTDIEVIQKEIDASIDIFVKSLEDAKKTNKELVENTTTGNLTAKELEQLIKEAQEIYDNIEAQLELIDIDKLAEKLKELEKDSHKHENMNVLNDLKEKDGKLTFKDIAVGVGGTRTQKEEPIDLQIGEQWHQIID